MDLYTDDAVTVRVPGTRRALPGHVFTDGGPFVYTLAYVNAELTRVDAEFMDFHLSRQRGDDDLTPYASVAVRGSRGKLDASFGGFVDSAMHVYLIARFVFCLVADGHLWVHGQKEFVDVAFTNVGSAGAEIATLGGAPSDAMQGEIRALPLLGPSPLDRLCEYEIAAKGLVSRDAMYAKFVEGYAGAHYVAPRTGRRETRVPVYGATELIGVQKAGRVPSIAGSLFLEPFVRADSAVTLVSLIAGASGTDAGGGTRFTYDSMRTVAVLNGTLAMSGEVAYPSVDRIGVCKATRADKLHPWMREFRDPRVWVYLPRREYVFAREGAWEDHIAEGICAMLQSLYSTGREGGWMRQATRAWHQNKAGESVQPVQAGEAGEAGEAGTGTGAAPRPRDERGAEVAWQQHGLVATSLVNAFSALRCGVKAVIVSVAATVEAPDDHAVCCVLVAAEVPVLLVRDSSVREGLGLDLPEPAVVEHVVAEGTQDEEGSCAVHAAMFMLYMLDQEPSRAALVAGDLATLRACMALRVPPFYALVARGLSAHHGQVESVLKIEPGTKGMIPGVGGALFTLRRAAVQVDARVCGARIVVSVTAGHTALGSLGTECVAFAAGLLRVLYPGRPVQTV
jgi:hypothetical protein